MEKHHCFISKTTISVALLFLLIAAASVHGQGTRVGFYSDSCPNAETIVSAAVSDGLATNPRIAPGLLRLHFHDCFIHGCDGSVLIEGTGTEKTAPPNSGINGYNVIDDAKARLEAACPNVVSCADILALAARDATVLTGGQRWDVPTGRRDGLVSLASDTGELPGPTETVTAQIDKLDGLQLDVQDLVVLLGSHTIGTTSCRLFRFRLFNFPNGTESGADPSIDPDFVPVLRALCPQNGDASRRVNLDNGSGSNFDTSYYNNLFNGRGILQSDQVLWTDPRTQPFVRRLLNPDAADGLDFGVEFGRSMIKMSLVNVKTSPSGEIRRVCTAIN